MKLFIIAMLLAQGLPASATEMPPIVITAPEEKKLSMKELHPFAFKCTKPIRIVWKPVKKTSDFTRLTKFVVLCNDCANWTSKKCEPKAALIGVSSSAGGFVLNANAVSKGK